ncbi:MAG: heavy-metal-associated domain-containing protein [Armatimonadetes bacterium]|nr:heavy-metal-associated domain-containing protein [Armatimonadota bacterium]
MAQFTAHASDITCDGCANAIRRALGRLDGVQSVDVDVPAKDVTVQYDESKVDRSQVMEKLSRAGFDSTLKD